MKMRPSGPWRDTTIQIVDGDKTVPLPAKTTEYSGGEKYPSVDIVAVFVPDANRTFVILGQAPGEQTLYFAASRGLINFSLSPGGGALWTPSYAAAPGDSLPAAIARFETSYDAAKLGQERHDAVVGSRISLRSANDPSFFANAPGSSFEGNGVTVERASVEREVVSLALLSPVTGHRAAFWIDLTQNKIVRATADGREVRPEPPRGYLGDVSGEAIPIYQEDFDAGLPAARARSSAASPESQEFHRAIEQWVKAQAPATP